MGNFDLLFEKSAKMNEEDKQTAGGAAIASVPVLGHHVYKRGLLHGRETLYHGTEKANKASILKEGLKAEKALDPNNWTSTVLNLDKAEQAGKTYMGRSWLTAADVQLAKMLRGHEDSTGKAVTPFNSTILKAKVPTWKMSEVKNPELKGAKNPFQFAYRRIRDLESIDPELKGAKNPFQFAYRRIRDLQSIDPVGDMVAYFELGPMGTFTNQGDIPAKYFVKSPKYEKVTLNEIKEYIKAKPFRFAAGAALAGLSFPLLGYGLYNVLNRKQDQKQEKVGENMYRELYQMWKKATENMNTEEKEVFANEVLVEAEKTAAYSAERQQRYDEAMQDNAFVNWRANLGKARLNRITSLGKVQDELKDAKRSGDTEALLSLRAQKRDIDRETLKEVLKAALAGGFGIVPAFKGDLQMYKTDPKLLLEPFVPARSWEAIAARDKAIAKKIWEEN